MARLVMLTDDHLREVSGTYVARTTANLTLTDIIFGEYCQRLPANVNSQLFRIIPILVQRVYPVFAPIS